MLLAVWIALAASVVFVTVAAVRAATRALQAWRAVKRLMRSVSERTGALAESAAATEAKAVAAGGNAAKLAAATDRLQRSLSVLAVLRAAAAEAAAGPQGLRKAMPRK